MQLVILAAGQGKRLENLGSNVPKCLVPIHEGQLYLSYQLKSFSSFTFSKKIIVGGFCFSVLQNFLQQAGALDFVVCQNSQFVLGNIFSLLAAREELTEDFFLFNADHYYSPETYKKIFETQTEEITVFCDQDRVLCEDDMKVQSHQGWAVQMSKTLKTFDWGYVGVTHVPQNKLDLYFKACYRTLKKNGEQTSVEAVINELAEEGEKIIIKDISGSWWTEIDTPEDLEKARRVIVG